MSDSAGTSESKTADTEIHSRVFGGGGREMIDPPTRIYRPGRSFGAHQGPPQSAKPVFILLALAGAVLGLVALGLNL